MSTDTFRKQLKFEKESLSEMKGVKLEVYYWGELCVGDKFFLCLFWNC